MKSNLTLIGMPGCGKSTCGVLVAKTLCKSFVDTDLLIQTREGLPLQKIIDRFGNDYFAKAEETVLAELSATDSVISTGGSAVYYPRAMEHLSEIGRVFYLRISFDTMVTRLGDIRDRGILLPEGVTLANMYESRTALYEKYADGIIDCDGTSVEEVVREISRQWGM